MNDAGNKRAVTLLAETDAAIGGFAATNIAFAAGAASDVALSTKSATTNCILKESFELVWKAVVSNETEVVTNTLGKTDGHVFYTIFEPSKTPWIVNSISNQNPWVSALDFIVSTNACEGATSKRKALESLVEMLFSKHGLTYDTQWGSAAYYLEATRLGDVFLLQQYIDKTGGAFAYEPRTGEVVNCYDQAYGVSVLAHLLGIENTVYFMEPFGYINETDLVGVKSCNNPFFVDSHGTVGNKLMGEDDPARSNFINHRFVSYDNTIFDACAGPALGLLSLSNYVSSVIDTSTPKELEPPAWIKIPGLRSYKAGEASCADPDTNSPFLIDL